MKLARKLNVYEQDRWLTLFLGLTHFCVAAAHGLFDIASTSLLVGELGPDTLPQVYLGSAIVLIVAGIVVIPFVDRLDRVRLFASVLIVFSLVLFVAPPLAARAPAIVYRGLYIACYLMKSLIFLQFWLLAGDLLDIRQAKRLFPVLLGFSLVGGLVASITASVVPQWVATEGLLTLAGGLLVGGLVTVEMVRRKFRPRLRRTHDKRPAIADAWKGFRDNLDISLRSPLLRTLSLCLLLLAMLAQVLDFLMGKAAHVQYMTPSGVDLDGLTSFYAILNGVVIGAGAIVQFLLANRLLSSLGVIRGQWLAPVTFVGAFVATGAVWLAGGGEMATSFFVVVLASRAVQKVMRISLVRTSTDLIFNAIPSERRGRAKAFKETLIEPAGVLLGGLLLLAGTALPLQYVLGGSLLLAVLFLMLAAQLKDRYLESLVHVLREKSRFRFAFPSLVMRKSEPRKTPASVSALRRALANEETSVRLLAVEVAAELKEPEAASLLV